MLDNSIQSANADHVPGYSLAEARAALVSLPQIVSTINRYDLARTHFTFTNIGSAPALSVTVDTLRAEGQTMDFETIEELRPGASLTSLSIVYPVIGNDPHWALDFWTGTGEELALPFVVRYYDGGGRRLVARSILKWDGHRIQFLPEMPVESAQ